MAVLRDIFRRRFRALMTIVGISVGVLAFVVMGALVERTQSMGRNIDDGMEGLIIVADEKDPGFMGMGASNPIPRKTIDALSRVDGVERVLCLVQIALEDEARPMAGAVIQGWAPLDGISYAVPGYVLAEGRSLRAGEGRAAVVGSDLVGQLGARVGGTIELRGREFEVVGILERTFVLSQDMVVIVPIEQAQAMYAATLPDAFRSRIDVEDIVLQATVRASRPEEADALARRIEREVDGVRAVGPSDVQATLSKAATLFYVVAASVGAVALIVGALAVLNTMMVAVIERTHEVGVKRALGATGWRIARDVVGESAVMSLLGGMLGLVAGSIVVVALNAATDSAKLSTWFVMTPRLVVGVLGFAVVLGVVGGLYPARYAARLEPIAALGHE